MTTPHLAAPALAPTGSVREHRSDGFQPIYTVDAVVLGLFNEGLKVALVRQTDPDKPAFGKYVLPGGGIQAAGDENTTCAIQRVLSEVLSLEPSYIEQAFTRGGPSRDSRGWSASLVHLAFAPKVILEDGVQAGNLELFNVWPTPDLPVDIGFDHALLVAQVVREFVSRAAYSTKVGHLLPQTFTLSELHRAYEVVCGECANSANFRRKILKYGVLTEVPSEEDAARGFGRPAQGYMLNSVVAYFDKNIL